MTRLDLADIQGNIHRPYGRFGFPHTRHLFFNVSDALAGRRFVQGVRPRVTTAEPWDTTEDPTGKRIVRKPPITMNLGFNHAGLTALDLPTRTLRLLPDEFIDGMRCRADILGDEGGSAPEHWDPLWQGEGKAAHIWVSLNAGQNLDGSPLPVLDEWTAWLEGLVAKTAGGVALLAGHGSDGKGRWQDSSAIMAPRPGGDGMMPLPIEHFGFTDGISDPVYRGQFDDPAAEALAVIGGGKIAEGPYDPDTSWRALETGEFILGQVDEGQELPTATEPHAFVRNGTFMVWRKLRQDVAAWDAAIAQQAAIWLRVNGGEGGVTSQHAAEETLRAKMVGRWRTGIPLAAAANWAEHEAMRAEHEACIAIALRKPRDSAETQRLAAYNKMLTSFRFGDDPDGAKCPLGAHIRRANPRDMLDPRLSAAQGASTLVNRRRIMRRGLPYVDPNGEQGIVFMAICTSLFRQFEFVQQQWINYGLDFESGNDTCPVIGNRLHSDKFVVPAGAAGATPFIAAGLPEFVVTRGGDYYFVPSISAIRMIAMGTTDPT